MPFLTWHFSFVKQSNGFVVGDKSYTHEIGHRIPRRLRLRQLEILRRPQRQFDTARNVLQRFATGSWSNSHFNRLVYVRCLWVGRVRQRRRIWIQLGESHASRRSVRSPDLFDTSRSKRQERRQRALFDDWQLISILATPTKLVMGRFKL